MWTIKLMVTISEMQMKDGLSETGVNAALSTPLQNYVHALELYRRLNFKIIKLDIWWRKYLNKLAFKLLFGYFAYSSIQV